MPARRELSSRSEGRRLKASQEGTAGGRWAVCRLWGFDGAVWVGDALGKFVSSGPRIAIGSLSSRRLTTFAGAAAAMLRPSSRASASVSTVCAVASPALRKWTRYSPGKHARVIPRACSSVAASSKSERRERTCSTRSGRLARTSVPLRRAPEQLRPRSRSCDLNPALLFGLLRATRRCGKPGPPWPIARTSPWLFSAHRRPADCPCSSPSVDYARYRG